VTTEPLAQIVITKNVLGQFKLSLMSTERTEEVVRGELCVTAWRAFRQMFRLKAVKGAAPNL
jgi:hypothetical protein